MLPPLLDFSTEADYNTVCNFIDILVSRYDFLSCSVIGETLLHKKIQVLTLGNEKSERSVLYVGGHHGAEWITALILLRMVNELCEYVRTSKQPFGINLQALLNTRCLRIIPLLNCDGTDIQINGVSEDCVLYDRLMRMSGGDFSKWQSNARGVDLNHNYDCGFLEYKSLEAANGIFAGSTRYAGEYPFSEPETMALSNYIRYHSSIEMILTLHASGEEIYCSSGDIVPERSRVIGEKFAKLSGYKLAKPEGLAAYGGLTDWFIREFNKPSFTIECGKGETPLPCGKYFEIYAGIREMLMCAPLMI